MTLSSEIVAAWEAAIFAHDTVKGVTDKYFTFDITADIDSFSEFAAGMSGARHKFFTLLASRQTVSDNLRGSNTTATRFIHTVDLDFFIEKNVEDVGRNYNEAIRVIEVVDDLVRSELGKKWSGTVDFWKVAQGRRPQLVELDGKKVWKCGYTYEAVKQV